MQPTANTLLNDQILKALCNTLLHSLWQGILLALITGAIIIFTKTSKAAFRYKLLIGALTLFALGVTATFIVNLQTPAANSTSIQTTAAQNINTAPVPAKAEGPNIQSAGTGMINETVISYLNTHYNLIVLIWFLIICAKTVQMAVGLHGVAHLKRTNVFKVGEDWENRLLQLAKQLHLEQVISLMESGIVSVPLVIGHLKPVILIPIGMINSLPANEVEAILIHELAHIRRRDYLVNLLQSFMEILFFFNPAVLWISQLIKTERENCCDDLAIAQSRNKENYIRALISCEEYQDAGTPYALAFPGTKNTLFYRVNRIVDNRNYSLSSLEKTILAVCLVVTGLGISAFTSSTRAARENFKTAPTPTPAVTHREARAEYKQPQATAEYKLPEAKADHQQPPANAPLASPAKPNIAKPNTAKPDTAKPAFDTTRVGSLPSLYENKHPGPYDDFLKQRSEEIAAELLRDNLVSDKNHFSYRLTRNELSIDGVRQPDELLRRIIDKYFKPDDNFNLGYIFRDPGSSVNAALRSTN